MKIIKQYINNNNNIKDEKVSYYIVTALKKSIYLVHGAFLLRCAPRGHSAHAHSQNTPQ